MTSWTLVAKTLRNLRLAVPAPASFAASQRAPARLMCTRVEDTPKKPEIPKNGASSENIKPSPIKINTDKLYKTIELEVLAYEPSVLDSYQWFAVTSATHLGITVGKCWSPLKSDKFRFPVLKSAFVHKKHQVHYEIRTHHRFLTFHKLTGSTADTFLEYIQRNLPEGCGMKVTRVEALPLPSFLQKH